MNQIDEDKIWEIRYIFFQDLLKEMSFDFNYRAASSIMGNPYAGESATDIIHDSNPMFAKTEGNLRRITRGDLSQYAQGKG